MATMLVAPDIDEFETAGAVIVFNPRIDGGLYVAPENFVDYMLGKSSAGVS